MEKTLSERSLWIDILRGFAIIVVMADHCSLRLLPVFEYPELPLFFLISGILWAGGRQRGFKKLMADKSRRLIPPYFIWGILFALVFCKDEILHGAWSWWIRHAIIFPQNGPLWFLKALWWAYLIVGALQAWGAFRTRTRSLIATAALMAVSTGVALCEQPEVMVYTCLPQGIIAASFLAIGLLIQRSGIIDVAVRVARSRRWWVMPLVGILFLASIIAILPDYIPVLVNMAKMGKPILLFYPMSLVCCAALFLIAVSLRRRDVLAFFGRNSMTIFCCHLFFCRALYILGMPTGWMMLLVVAICSAFTAVAVNALKKRWRVLQYLG